mmetsp:Transcript_8292/g.15526  ORF Transcript_8292/g.15526 Transcript_8292/m.15526 type:complete len:92 (-) Transcript_8292:41-316(-)
MATIDVEENVITQITSNEMPLVKLFGSGPRRIQRDTIIGVGNYGKMHRRTLGQNASRVDRNSLNVSPFSLYLLEIILLMSPSYAMWYAKGV